LVERHQQRKLPVGQSERPEGPWIPQIERTVEIWDVRGGRWDETIEATVADSADNPEVVLQKKNRDQFVRTALTTLSPEHREIIDLVYYHDKSVDECAQILGVPSGTVKTRVFYARKKLAELVQAA